MFKFINSLSINKRLQFISVLIVIFIVICFGLLWRSLGTFNRDLEQIKVLTELELQIWQMRSNYNAIRGDFMQIFIADPVTQKTYSEEAIALLHGRINELHQAKEEISKGGALPEHIAQYYAEFEADLARYIHFCEENLTIVQNASIKDSSNYINVRDLLVIEFNKHFTLLRKNAVLVVKATHTYKEGIIQQLDKERAKGIWFTIALSGALLIVIFFVLRLISRSILTPIKETELILEKLAAGELPEIRAYHGKDELSRMLESLRELNIHMHYTMEFAGNVAQNNFEVKAAMFGGNGPIASALINMRDSLKEAYYLERQRSWATKGIAELGTLVRRQENLEKLYDEALAFVIKYVSANQGVLYIRGDRGEEQEKLVMVAGYAYGRKKFMTSTINIGDGLAGQAFLEGELVHLKEIPQGYIKITSGLGAALPNNLVISPLIAAEETYGVLEIASFQEFTEPQLDFIKKISEELAVVIRTARVNMRTNELLEESQLQAEQMSAQEEEMRQSLEELEATQEAIRRRDDETRELLNQSRDKAQQLQEREAQAKTLISMASEPLMAIDRKYCVTFFNQRAKEMISMFGLEMREGFNVILSNDGSVNTVFKKYYDRAFKGEKFSIEVPVKGSQGEIQLRFNYTPILNGGDIIGTAVHFKALTALGVGH